MIYDSTSNIMLGGEQVPVFDVEPTMSKCCKVELSRIVTSATEFREELKDNPIFGTCVVVGDLYAVIFAGEKAIELLSTAAEFHVDATFKTASSTFSQFLVIHIVFLF